MVSNAVYLRQIFLLKRYTSPFPGPRLKRLFSQVIQGCYKMFHAGPRRCFEAPLRRVLDPSFSGLRCKSPVQGEGSEANFRELGGRPYPCGRGGPQAERMQYGEKI